MKLLFENWQRFLMEEYIVPSLEASDIAIYDFDETIAKSTGFIMAIHVPTGREKKITTQEEYDGLKVTNEYEFDFSNLSKITDPIELTQITKNLRKDVSSPGIQVVILTARMSDVEDDIHSYLESIGVVSSDVIIIGCGGCNKGEFVEKMVSTSPSIKNIIFYDDSQENIRNLQDSKERLKDRINNFEIVDVSDPLDWKRT